MTLTKNVWKVAALLLILSLISAVMISGTYAQYTSTYAGEDTALVAKWNIVASGDGISMADGETTELDLFNHEYDNNVTTSAGGAYIIAPGVKGDFTLQFANNSDVAAAIEFNVETISGSANVPIEYSFASDFSSPKTISELETALNDDAAFNDVAVGVPVAKTVYWRWKFNGDNGVDTELGKASAAAGLEDRTSYGLSITATAEQKAPAKDL